MNFLRPFNIYLLLVPLWFFPFVRTSPVASSSSEETATTTTTSTSEITTTISSEPLDSGNQNERIYENAEMPRPNDAPLTTTHPTFTGLNGVERLDAPIERIEIRLIDENTTKTETNGGKEITEEPRPTGQSNEDSNSDHNYPTTTEKPQESIANGEAGQTQSLANSDEQVPTANTFANSDSMYKKVEYVVQATEEPLITSTSPSSISNDPITSDPVPVAEDPSYFSTMSTNKQASSDIQAKAWISVSVSTTIPKFEGDIDEDDLPPPQSQEDENDEKEPEEECLANKDQLSEEVVTRLKAETAHYYRLVRQRNEQQKEYCSGENAVNQHSDMYRRCSEWRAEKLVYYYKLMRKTYCQVENWPNPSKVKKTYGEYLNLFGTFYAFQK